MGKLIFGGLLLLISFFLMLARSGSTTAGRPAANLLRIFSLGFATFGILIILAALVVVIDPGQVGVKHAFGTVDPKPLLSGIHMVAPWSSIERYSAREEQYPAEGDQVETIAALSSEQMGMTVDAGLRWQINPQDAPKIFNEIGKEEQIHSIVRNAIRKGVRDGMVRFSINDISQRTKIAEAMQALVDSRAHHPAAGRRRALQDRRGDRLLPPGSAAARAGGAGHQQQDRPGAADRDRAPPGRGRAAAE